MHANNLKRMDNISFNFFSAFLIQRTLKLNEQKRPANENVSRSFIVVKDF